MSNKFEGIYVKCSNDKESLAIILGRNKSKLEQSSFVQLITSPPESSSYNVVFDYGSYKEKKKPFEIHVDKTYVNNHGMSIDINEQNLKINGKVSFGSFSPIKYDIMGPFKFFPFMECRHRIESMRHKVSGQISVNGRKFLFGEGSSGYIEGDRGCSFPKKYFWTQCSNAEVSISASCAIIPYLKLRFTGTICVIHFGGKEIRLATYLGAKVLCFTSSKLQIIQGRKNKRLNLEITVLDKNDSEKDKQLFAPANGSMGRIIQESLKRKIHYKLTKNEKIIFDFVCDNAAYEFSDTDRSAPDDN